MKELNHTFTDKFSVIESNINLYIHGCNILKLYIANPTAIATDINNSYNTTLKGNFSDIVNGLKGEFTRSKASELGKLQIVSYLENLSNTISNNYTELYSNVNEYVNTVTDNVNVIDNTININTLNIRKDTFTKDKLSIDYLERKTNAVLESDAKQVSDTLSVLDFLNNIVYIIDMLPNINITKLKDDLVNITSARTGMSTLIKHLDINPYKHNVDIVKDNSLEITDNDTIIKNIFNNNIKDNSTSSVHELLIVLINKLPVALTTLKESINSILDVIGNIVTVNETINYINNIKNEALLPYSEGSITSSEFDIILNSYKNVVNDSLVVDYNHVVTIANICLTLNAKIYVYLYMYSIADKATLNGTLVTNNIKVSG